MYLVSILEANYGQAQAPLLQTPPALKSLVKPTEVNFHNDPIVNKGGVIPVQNYQILNPAPTGPHEIQGLPLPAPTPVQVPVNYASYIPTPTYIQQQAQPTINPTWTSYTYQNGPAQPNLGSFQQATMGQNQAPATQFYPIMGNQTPMNWNVPDILHHLEPTPKSLVWHTLPQLQFHFPNMEPSHSIYSSPVGMTMSPFGGSMSPPPPMYPSCPCCPPPQSPGQVSQLSHEFSRIKVKSKGQKKLKQTELKQKETMGKEKVIFCKLCKSNNETQVTYESHVTVDGNGITRCPVLRALVCPLCGASGDFAHTMKYCPKVLEKKQIGADEKQEKEEVGEEEPPRELVPVPMENSALQEVQQPQTLNLENENSDLNRSTVGGYFNVKY